MIEQTEKKRHFLYCIFRRDRDEHPMPEPAVLRILSAIRALTASNTKEKSKWNGIN